MHDRKSGLKNRKFCLGMCLALILVTGSAWANQELPLEKPETWIKLYEQMPLLETEQLNEPDDILRVGLRNNSQLKSLYAQWRMKLEQVNTVVVLPDPTLSLGYFIEPVETAQGPQAAKISLSQAIPWQSQQRASKHIIQAQAEQVYLQLMDAAMALNRDLRVLLADEVFNAKARIIASQKLALVQDLEGVLEMRYKSASLDHSDFAEAHIQTLTLRELLNELEDEQARNRIKRNALLEVDLQISDLALAAMDLPIMSEVQGVHQDRLHPRLDRLEKRSQEIQAKETLAKSDYYPDFRVGLDYIMTDPKILNGAEVTGSGKDPLIVSMGFELPLWNWRAKKAQLKSTQWEGKQVDAAKTQERIHQEQELALAQSILKGKLRQIALYKEELIPQSQEIIQVLEQGYISDAVGLTAYTAAQLKLLDLQLQLLKAQRSAWVQSAILAYWEG